MNDSLTDPLQARSHQPDRRFAGTWTIAVALSAFYLATSLYISSHRLLWIDEVLAVSYARLRGWTTIWKASAQAVVGLAGSQAASAREVT